MNVLASPAWVTTCFRRLLSLLMLTSRQTTLFRPIGTVDLEVDTESVMKIANAKTAGIVILDALQRLAIEPELKPNE